MSEPTPSTPTAQPARDRQEPARRLWELWREGQRPEVRDFLAGAPNPSLTQCLAVVRVDQQERWLRGEQIRAEDYLQQCFFLALDDERVLDLVYGEFLLRERLGEAPSLAEYGERFPQFAESLRLQVELHRALELRSRSALVAIDQESADRATIPARRGVAGEQTKLPTVPGYEILGLLGEGGMGVVYQARQLGLNRLVALKLARTGQPGEPELRRRFKAEAEAAARLQHPNIIQIFEVGEHDGLPYLAMEYANGGSLEERLDGTPLPAREAAAAIATLADALEGAHRRGIIHRDLKPANILLTGAADAAPADCTLKLADFGLAKQLDSEGGRTLSGAILGTPAYMAPEQAQGNAARVGPAADIHALGVLLYELLTGRPPFNGSTLSEVLEQVRSAEPVPPRRLQPKVPRDLETIALKCLQKEPQRRYASAAALAEDLQRFAAGRPIRARPVGQVERGWCWCRRNPVVACLTATLFVAVVLGFSFVLGYAWQAEADRGTAHRERGEAVRQRDRAVKHVALAREAVDRYCTFVSENRLLREPAMDGLRRELLQAAVQFYEQFARQSSDDPEIQLEQGRAYLRLADLTADLGSKPDAIRVGEKGLRLLERLAAARPKHRLTLHLLAHAYHSLGISHNDSGQYDRAEELYRKALELREQHAGRWPSDADYQDELAAIHLNLGAAHLRRARVTEAETAFRASLKLREQLASTHPSHPGAHSGLGISLLACADFYAETARPEQAEPLARKSLQLLERGPSIPAIDAHLAKTYAVLGAVQASSGRYHEALAAYTKAVKGLERLANAHPLNTEYRRTLALTHCRLAHVHAASGQAVEVEAALRQAVGLFTGVVRDDPEGFGNRDWLARSYEHLGQFYVSEGRQQEAKAAFDKAIEGWVNVTRGRAGTGDALRARAIAYQRLARCYGRLGRMKDAESAFLALLELVRELDASPQKSLSSRRDAALAYRDLGSHYTVTGNPEKAAASFRAALAIVERLAQADAPPGDLEEATAHCWVMLAWAHQCRGNPRDVEEALAKGVRICEKLARDEAQTRARLVARAQMWGNIALVNRGLKRFAEARAALRQALTIQEEVACQAPAEPEGIETLARLYNSLGELASVTNRGEAPEWYRLSIGALKGLLEVRPQLAAARSLLLDSYRIRVAALGQLPRTAEVIADCDEALAFADPLGRSQFLIPKLAALLLRGEHARAMDEARAMPDRAPLSSKELASLAWLNVLCGPLIRGDKDLPAVDKQQRLDRCAAETVRLLSKAHTAGHFTLPAHRDWLEKTSQFDVLRPRADFQQLLAEVRRAANPLGKDPPVP